MDKFLIQSIDNAKKRFWLCQIGEKLWQILLIWALFFYFFPRPLFFLMAMITFVLYVIHWWQKKSSSLEIARHIDRQNHLQCRVFSALFIIHHNIPYVLRKELIKDATTHLQSLLPCPIRYKFQLPILFYFFASIAFVSFALWQQTTSKAVISNYQKRILQAASLKASAIANELRQQGEKKLAQKMHKISNTWKKGKITSFHAQQYQKILQQIDAKIPKEDFHKKIVNFFKLPVKATGAMLASKVQKSSKASIKQLTKTLPQKGIWKKISKALRSKNTRNIERHWNKLQKMAKRQNIYRESFKKVHNLYRKLQNKFNMPALGIATKWQQQRVLEGTLGSNFHNITPKTLQNFSHNFSKREFRGKMIKTWWPKEYHLVITNYFKARENEK